MKVACYIYDSFKERGVKSFELRVYNTLKNYGITGEIGVHDAWMERANGRGSYYKTIEISVNKVVFTLRSYTNDSQLWDDFEGTKKEKRQLFEAVLNENIEKLIELIAESEELGF